RSRPAVGADRSCPAGRQFHSAQRRRGHLPRPRQPGLRNDEDEPAQRTLPRRRRLHLQVRGAMLKSRIRGTVPVLALALTGLLAGCAHRDSITVGAVPDDYRTNHPIVLTEKEQVLDLPVGVLAYLMTPQQKAAVDGFMQTSGDSGHAVLTVPVPAGSANGAAANRVAQDLTAFAHRRGVPKGHVPVLAYQAGPDEVAPIRLSYSVMKAS